MISESEASKKGKKGVPKRYTSLSVAHRRKSGNGTVLQAVRRSLVRVWKKNDLANHLTMNIRVGSAVNPAIM